MNWERIIDAVNGRPQSLAWFARRRPNADAAALATLLLLDDAPHPAAALVAAATSPDRTAPLVHAALAPHIAPALADWRADSRWVDRAVGGSEWERLTSGIADLVGALRDHPAALHDAVAIVRCSGHSIDVAHCLAALGADGWRALTDDLGAALSARADPDDLGWVWDALDDAQRARVVQHAATSAYEAAQLIGRIGAAAWGATDPALRKRLIGAVVRSPLSAPDTAPAWPGMTDDERARLATAIIRQGDATGAFHLLDDLGAAGRATLTADLRAALERRAMEHPDAWLVLALRAADAGWNALTADARAAVLAAAEEQPQRVPDLLRVVGAAGWTAMSADERERIIAIMRCTPNVFFRCPPALWGALGGDDPPPPRTMPRDAADHWRAEDADADLGALPPSHQTLVLALAPWRTEDATKDSVRVPRLCMAWHALTVDARVALVLAHPSVLAAVAAAARLRGGGDAVLDAVGETVARWAAMTDGAAAKGIVGAMLRTPDDRRAWMTSFAPTAADPPEAWTAWRAAARRGLVADIEVCARLAATERRTSESRRGALRRRATAPCRPRKRNAHVRPTCMGPTEIG